MKVDITIERTRTGYSAYADKYAVYTTGKKLNELKLKMIEALKFLRFF